MRSASRRSLLLLSRRKRGAAKHNAFAVILNGAPSATLRAGSSSVKNLQRNVMKQRIAESAPRVAMMSTQTT